MNTIAPERAEAEEPVVHEPLISVDSHVHFTDDWVKERMSAKIQKRWDEAQAKAAEHNEKVQRKGQKQLSMEDFVDLEAAMDPGHFEPHAKLSAMDRDGVQAEVIFPEVGAMGLCRPSYMGEDWKEALSSFNRAMVDFASVSPKRLLAAYQIALHDVDFAVSEVHRVARAGGRCIQLPTFPSEVGLPDINDPRYDPLWSAISETGLTILNHLEMKEAIWDVFTRDPTPQKGIMTSLPALAMSEALAFWILTGTLERFPKLRVIFIEPALGWLPWYIGMLDKRMHMHYRFPHIKKLPSEYFKTQMGATFMDEPEGLQAAYKAFGPECLYWSTDFPHPATCWPNSQRQVKSQFAEAGIPEADRRKIVYENAKKAFGLGE
jgi:predicted TIM-barrel fold metal-dependent hydrolase